MNVNSSLVSTDLIYDQSIWHFHAGLIKDIDPCTILCNVHGHFTRISSSSPLRVLNDERGRLLGGIYGC